MREYAKVFGWVLIGNTLIAIGIQMFLAPNHLVIGGTNGIAIITNYLTGWPTGLVIFIINIPLFLCALKFLGFFFLLTSITGIVIISVLVDLFAFWELVFTEEMILVAIFGGLFIGTGIALVFRAGSSTGGMDLLARLVMLRWPDMTLGGLLFVFDGLVILAGALVFRQLDMALYAIISVYVLKRSVDAVLHKGNKEKSEIKQ